MTVKNDFPASWRSVFGETPGREIRSGRKIVLNRHFVLRGSPVPVKPRLMQARSTRRATPRRRRRPPPAGRGPSETPVKANPTQGSASMGSCRSWFDGDAGNQGREKAALGRTVLFGWEPEALCRRLRTLATPLASEEGGRGVSSREVTGGRARPSPKPPRRTVPPRSSRRSAPFRGRRPRCRRARPRRARKARAT